MNAENTLHAEHIKNRSVACYSDVIICTPEQQLVKFGGDFKKAGSLFAADFAPTV